MRIVLMANESIGFDCLKTLFEAKQDIAAVVTDSRHDNTIWRNQKLIRLASEANIKHLQTNNINSPEFVSELELLAPDVILNIAFVQIYKTPVLQIPKSGCINYHPGPLPRYGGSIGWVWAIINGESEYGVAFHYMKEKVDTGDIIGIERFPVAKDETGLTLLAKCYRHGANLFRKVLADLSGNKVSAVSQNLQERTYYYNKVPFEGLIDVNWSATKIERFVRALTFSPLPNPLSPPMLRFARQNLVVTKALVIPEEINGGVKPGEILQVCGDRLVMRTGDGTVMLTVANLEDHIPLSAAARDSSKISLGVVLGD